MTLYSPWIHPQKGEGLGAHSLTQIRNFLEFPDISYSNYKIELVFLVLTEHPENIQEVKLG